MVIFDESMHQRMLLTLLVSMFSPSIRFVLMMHQLAFTRRSNSVHKAITRYIDTLMIRRSWRSISAGLQITDLATELAGSAYKSKIKTVLATPQNAIADDGTKAPFRLLFVGSITHTKGIHYLIEALSRVEPALRSKLRVTLVGNVDNPAYEAECIRLAESTGVTANIEWIGYLPFQELSEQYKQATVFLFPSISECMPMALLEAMSAGCVPIAFDNTAMPYLIQHGENGLLATNLDAADLARQIEAFYHLDHDRRTAMREGARQTAARYSRTWDEVSEQYRQFLIAET